MKENLQYIIDKEIISPVISSEGFDHNKGLESSYEQSFVPLEAGSGDRCVDGRALIESMGNIPTGLLGENYKGMQMPGGTLGVIDVLKKVTGFSELTARSVVLNTYNKNHLIIAAHIDDNHGTINNIKDLQARKTGCGDQSAKKDGLLPMFKNQNYEEDLFSQRLEWIIKNQGKVFALTADHTEKLAAVNTDQNSTFDTHKVVTDNKESIFNCDIAAVFVRSGLIYDEILARNKVPDHIKSREDFQITFTRDALRNYFQTLVALKQPPKVQIRK